MTLSETVSAILEGKRIENALDSLAKAGWRAGLANPYASASRGSVVGGAAGVVQGWRMHRQRKRSGEQSSLAKSVAGGAAVGAGLGYAAGATAGTALSSPIRKRAYR